MSGLLVVVALFRVSALTVLVPGEFAPHVSVLNGSLVSDSTAGMSGEKGKRRVPLPFSETIDVEFPNKPMQGLGIGTEMSMLRFMAAVDDERILISSPNQMRVGAGEFNKFRNIAQIAFVWLPSDNEERWST